LTYYVPPYRQRRFTETESNHRRDPAKRLKDDADAFCKAPTLNCALHIINAATTLEVVYEVSLAGKFSGQKVFVEELKKALPNFYQEAGQLLKAW
jgi:hypothetical protein